MLNMDKVPTRWDDQVRFLTHSAQAAAFLGVISLVCAILYNVVRFWFVDPILLTTFTISDHIATAIKMLPVILPVTLAYLMPLPLSKSMTSGVAWFALIASVACGVLVWLVFASVGEGPKGAMGGAAAVALGWAVGGDFLVRQRLSRLPKNAQFAGRIVAMLIILLVAYGVVGGTNVAIGKAGHRVQLADGKSVQGNIVQILDRGIVLIELPTGKVLFIPKDQYSGIEKLGN